MNKQSQAKTERGVLPRSGNSFAGYGEVHRFGALNDHYTIDGLMQWSVSLL